ncbi:tetratricopeptide repeat protein 33 [Limosa lapponica baueri]|uniref:Tetratricopeptide repeat protein 33 n=1 Tax=Limosa lapponica baueri TaxID=1758121 RepID=A0A2I0TZ95_LIMLA|nr:tetratricopeptide repeat protein 33 [Limosa lapponica baueri]
MSRCPSGVCMGTSTVHDVDSGIEYTLRNFEDATKLSGVFDMTEGQYAIQRELDRPEKLAHVNFMSFNKTTKVIKLGYLVGACMYYTYKIPYILSLVTRTQGNGTTLCQGKFRLDIKKKFITSVKGGQSPELAPQGCDHSTKTIGVQGESGQHHMV